MQTSSVSEPLPSEQQCRMMTDVGVEGSTAPAAELHDGGG